MPDGDADRAIATASFAAGPGNALAAPGSPAAGSCGSKCAAVWSVSFASAAVASSGRAGGPLLPFDAEVAASATRSAKPRAPAGLPAGLFGPEAVLADAGF